jgi:pyruvate dehydrogenase E1 component
MKRDIDPTQTREWVDSIRDVLSEQGPGRAQFLLSHMIDHAVKSGVDIPYPLNTPYVNTIPVEEEPPYPGDRAIERRIKSILRWNAMAMVVQANRRSDGIGGHISSYASAATLLEVGFHHFFRARTADFLGDQVFFQGHSSPGIYARAFLEGRMSVKLLHNFRRELAEGGGLSSYPHPWLMPEFWQFPTVSMGLTSLQAIYQARFNRYLKDRGILDTEDATVWAFLGDGEMDEPESLGAITLASRERLSNLKFVINCNLQRLDGPVRGNGKIIQELEAAFRGAGWNVIKVLWGSDWDPLLAEDKKGLLMQRMEEVVDGQYQKYIVESGEYTRNNFFGKHAELLDMVAHLSDKDIRRLRRGGHDPAKVHAAYKSAMEHEESPTVILAKTVKGYGLGEAGEGRNVTHQQKKLNEDELREFRDRFDIPIPDKDLVETPFFRPPDDSEEIQYLRDRRRQLGGFVPKRMVAVKSLETPSLDMMKDFLAGSADRQVSTTMAAVQILAKLLRDKQIGKFIVPIVPDEARTFGMEALFRGFGIYAHQGQLYEPVDSHLLLYYREAKDGQILEEGITEAGSMASFIAAGTCYATHAVHMIPFFIFYSMFGFQRIGDLIWAAGDQRARGFVLGATSGRTTLAGEGLQHQDGHSHVLSSTVPNVVSFDPAYAYELAIIFQDGLRRMYQDNEDVFYYITLGNETYPMPAMPEGCREGILKGLYRLQKTTSKQKKKRIHLLGSGAILNEVLRARDMLADDYGVAADVWSVPSYGEVRREALTVERWNMLHPEEEPRVPYVTEQLSPGGYPVIAASDYMKSMPHSLSVFVPQGVRALGTDGFGRSENRKSLRRHFEVDAESIVVKVLMELAKKGDVTRKEVAQAITKFEFNPEKPDPAKA